MQVWKWLYFSNQLLILKSSNGSNECGAMTFVFTQGHIVTWEPEGHYCISKMFRWEPEGRYRHRIFTATASFWFSMEHLWTAIMPFRLSTDDIRMEICRCNLRIAQFVKNLSYPNIPIKYTVFCFFISWSCNQIYPVILSQCMLQTRVV